MKIALDPYMFRALPVDDMVRTVAELGYEYIELSPREDFMPFFLHPRADDGRVAELKNSLRAHGVQLSSVLPLYKWSSPDEAERQAAVRYWKRMIEITSELECPLMNSEFNGRPERAAAVLSTHWVMKNPICDTASPTKAQSASLLTPPRPTPRSPQRGR